MGMVKRFTLDLEEEYSILPILIEKNISSRTSTKLNRFRIIAKRYLKFIQMGNKFIQDREVGSFTSLIQIRKDILRKQKYKIHMNDLYLPLHMNFS
jgi:hypothetical protein